MELRNTSLLISADVETASREAAEIFVCAAIRAVAARGVFFVAVPGGSSPRGLFEALSAPEYVELVPWSRTELFFTDERCVPPDSSESNYRLVSELLISTVPIPEANVHRFHGEDDPETAAQEYEQELHRVMGSSPRFDLIVLGMGQDAHTASLFPHSPALHESVRHAAANHVVKLGAHRLTLTLPVINHAERIIILAFGSEKADTLAHVLHEPRDIEERPVQAVQPTHGRLVWVVDQAAAAEL